MLHNRSLAPIVLFFVLVFSYSHQKWWQSPTAASRLCLLYEICAHGRLAVNDSILSTPDTALFNGRLYSDKAPGMAVAALPGFAAGWFGAGACGLKDRERLLVASWLGCATSAGLVLAIGGALLCAALTPRVGSRSAFLAVCALLLGGMPLVYATVMHSHSLVVGLLCIALWAVLEAPSIPGHLTSKRNTSRRDALFGFCTGYAVASEYTAGLVVIGMGLYFLQTAGWRRALWGAAWAIPPLLLIPLYSWLTIGDPFHLPYSYQSSFPEMKKGLYAIRWPDLETAYNLLFSPQRGLLFWSPCLAMVVFGYPRLMRESPRLFLLTYIWPLLQIIVISGRVWDWPAGPTFGPRYLAPILPLLALPLALGLRRLPWLGIPLLGYSVAVTMIACVTDACVNYQTTINPLLDINWPAFKAARLGPNLLTALGLPPHFSLFAFAALIVLGVYAVNQTLPKEGAQTPPHKPREARD